MCGIHSGCWASAVVCLIKVLCFGGGCSSHSKVLVHGFCIPGAGSYSFKCGECSAFRHVGMSSLWAMDTSFWVVGMAFKARPNL
jgi:hypothetical protein